ncbi:RHS repeat-associated core domain-containing protein [Geotalea uraniireducens]
MTDGSGKTTYNYDLSGRVTRTVKTVDNVDYTIVKSYDGMGRLNNITYPDGESVDYHYDAAGNLFDISGYAEYDEYNALGQPGKLYYGNGIVTSYWYYPQNYRLFAMKADQLQNSLLYRTYNYDSKGNMIDLNDLVNPSIPHNLTYGSVGYTLDPTRAHAVQTASTAPGRVYQYDDNGNMTSDGQRTVTYTPDNLPKTATMNGVTTTFIYDGNGKRVKKLNSNTRMYIGKLYECINGNCGNYIFAGNTRIARNFQGSTIYYHPDHLGSTAITTDDYGNKVEDIYYYPYGETRLDSKPIGGMTHKYTAQELDYETGLYNYGARLYDPDIGRFISPDSIVPSPGNPQSLNRYAYALNNPVKYRDPSGHSPRSCALGFCSTVVNTAAVYAAPTGVGGAIVKGTGIGLSLLSMGNAYYEHKTGTMSDFDYKATMGLESLNLLSVGSAAAAAKIGRNIETVVETAEVADRSIATMTRAAGVPLFTKDVFETYGEHSSSTAKGNAFDQSLLGSGQIDGSLSYLLSQSPMPDLPSIPTYTLPTYDFNSWYQNYTPGNNSTSGNTGSTSDNSGSTTGNSGSSGGGSDDDGGDDGDAGGDWW